MAKKRVRIIFGVFLIVFLIFFISSSFFKLSLVEIVFYDKDFKNEIDLKNNRVYTSNTKLEELKTLAVKDFGQSIFLINTQKYYKNFEAQNPYAKLLQVKSKYPNKLIFCVSERQPFFVVSSDVCEYILDEEFKIIEIRTEKNQDLMEILCFKDNKVVSYFEFFNISPYAFVEGQFLNENNLLLQAIKNLNKIFYKTTVNFNNIDSLTFSETKKGEPDLIIKTFNNYGASFKISNFIEKFDEKLLSVLLEFEKSLIQNEQIKICFGLYEINKDMKVVWNNL